MPDSTAAPTAAKKLLLVDAYSLLFRAFFASRSLSTTDNRPTGALFGFANMLFTLLNAEKPDSIVVCWDAPEQTLRSQEFKAYKAHRPEVDPQLRAQMPEARRLVEAMAIQSAELGGYEADDLIGTIAQLGVKEGFTVTILTGDSDQLQLVREGITLQMTQRGVTEVKVYDADAVRERYGIGPERIPDWKALVGDTSDNIPGVPGIGDKTATALLQRWDTIENLLAHIEEVTPPKVRAALEANSAQPNISKRLATIVCDAPLDFTLRSYAPTADDWQRLRDLFAEYEFKSLLARIPRTEGPIRERARPENTFSATLEVIRSARDLTDAIDAARRSGRVAVRPNMTGGSPIRAELRGIAFSPSPGVAYYVKLQEIGSPSLPPPARAGTRLSLDSLTPKGSRPYGPGERGGEEIRRNEGLSSSQNPANLQAETAGPDAYEAVIEDIRVLFESPAIEKAAHDAKRIAIVVERAGLSPTPFAFDTMIAAYLLNAGRSSYPLMDLAESHIDARLEAQDSFAPEQTLALEAALVSALRDPLEKRLEQAGMSAILNSVEMPLIPVLSSIERAGLLLDRSYIDRLGADMAVQIDALAREIYLLAGEEFNIGSTKQLQSILFDKLQLPTGKKTKTGFSTGADLLDQLAPQYDIARLIIEYRELAKLKATYTDALTRLVDPDTGRIHTSLNQTVASSGRLSSSDPNLQNIPVRSEIGRKIRRAFIAPPGKVLLSCDYSQIELRILAHITKDPALAAAFELDEDVHIATAATVFGVPIDEVTADQRRQAKTINVAVIYGQSGFGLASTLGVSASLANAWIKKYLDRLPGVKRYVEETTALAHRQKYVSTLMGRRRYIPELDSPNHAMRQYGERAAVNMPIQGTAADIMKLAMISVHDYLAHTCPGGCTLLLQVHDELLFEVEEEVVASVTPEIVRRMESAFPLDVRLKVDSKAGPNWADMSAQKPLLQQQSATPP